MSAMLQANHRVRCEIFESTAGIRLARGLITRQGAYGALAFMHEYVLHNTRFPTIHTRHAPLLEPGYPAVRERVIG